MESYKTRIIKYSTSFVLVCKRHKRSLGILSALITIVLSYGLYHQGSTDKNISFVSSHDENVHHKAVSEGKLIYDISSSQRPYQWKEVISGDILLTDSTSMNIVEGKDSTKNENIFIKDGVSENDESNSAKDEKQKRKISTHNSSQIIAVKSEELLSQKKTIRVKGIVLGPHVQVILARGDESNVVGIGDSWKSVRIVSVSDRGVLVEEGGHERWLSLES